MDAFAEFSATDEWMQLHILAPLNGNGAVVVPCEVRIHDVKGNHLTTGKVFWQIKDWSQVKTKT